MKKTRNVLYILLVATIFTIIGGCSKSKITLPERDKDSKSEETAHIEDANKELLTSNINNKPSIFYEKAYGFEGSLYHSDKYSFDLPYRLYIPQNYDHSRKYPMVVAMHGVGKKGDDNIKQLEKAPWATVWTTEEVQNKYPCFVYAPHCPTKSSWVNTSYRKGSYDSNAIEESAALKTAMEILENLLNDYNIDRSRIYLNGNSMGAYASWYMATEYNDIFTAMAAYAGAGDPSKADRLVNIPIWAFHAVNDNVVPVSGSQDMIKAIKAKGGNPKYTEDAKAGHGVHTVAFSLDEDNDGELDLVTWMFAQKKE